MGPLRCTPPHTRVPPKGPREAEDVQPPPPEHSTEPDPAPTPPPDAEQPPAQGTEDEAVARELEQLYLSHLRRLRGGPRRQRPPPRETGVPPFPERAPNTSLANEMALRYEGGGSLQPPGAAGEGGGPVEGALVVPARPPRGRGSSLGGGPEGVRGGFGLGRAGPGGLGGRGGVPQQPWPWGFTWRWPGSREVGGGGGENPRLLSPPKNCHLPKKSQPPPGPFHL
ncbi:splicing factor, proline- and glutamine-rich-like [Haemorhous mexicanus]|uniref:splicing factor, proline- and glutamine-rich-like n=1 Tax=Haemorhous mexicanus TaxID=30427 RepID=UPI0028BF0F44|nr:splicing factor, proline- and glutamine-rich-like [Haemorhous mexicanus]